MISIVFVHLALRPEVSNVEMRSCGLKEPSWKKLHFLFVVFNQEKLFWPFQGTIHENEADEEAGHHIYFQPMKKTRQCLFFPATKALQTKTVQFKNQIIKNCDVITQWRHFLQVLERSCLLMMVWALSFSSSAAVDSWSKEKVESFSWEDMKRLRWMPLSHGHGHQPYRVWRFEEWRHRVHLVKFPPSSAWFGFPLRRMSTDQTHDGLGCGGDRRTSQRAEGLWWTSVHRLTTETVEFPYWQTIDCRDGIVYFLSFLFWTFDEGQSSIKPRYFRLQDLSLPLLLRMEGELWSRSPIFWKAPSFLSFTGLGTEDWAPREKHKQTNTHKHSTFLWILFR